MVIDTGIPPSMMRDILQMTAAHVDYWKFGFASASVCPVECVTSKVALCQEYGVYAYPGGTSLEIAVVRGIWKEFLQSLWEGGVRVIEVSDGTIDLPLKTRREIIRTAHHMGFTVLSEIGKKVSGLFLPVARQVQMIQGDLNSGANYVIVEGRESGKGIGVYDHEGNVRERDVEALVEALGPLATRLIWEAPRKNQQIFYIQHFGNKVNLGNIPPLEVTALESLRRGFRSDTLRTALDIPTAQEPDGTDEEGMTDTGGTMRGTAPPTAPKLWTDSTSRRRTEPGSFRREE